MKIAVPTVLTPGVARPEVECDQIKHVCDLLETGRLCGEDACAAGCGGSLANRGYLTFEDRAHQRAKLCLNCAVEEGIARRETVGGRLLVTVNRDSLKLLLNKGWCMTLYRPGTTCCELVVGLKLVTEELGRGLREVVGDAQEALPLEQWYAPPEEVADETFDLFACVAAASRPNRRQLAAQSGDD